MGKSDVLRHFKVTSSSSARKNEKMWGRLTLVAVL